MNSPISTLAGRRELTAFIASLPPDIRDKATLIATQDLSSNSSLPIANSALQQIARHLYSWRHTNHLEAPLFIPPNPDLTLESLDELDVHLILNIDEHILATIAETFHIAQSPEPDPRQSPPTTGGSRKLLDLIFPQQSPLSAAAATRQGLPSSQTAFAITWRQDVLTWTLEGITYGTDTSIILSCSDAHHPEVSALLWGRSPDSYTTYSCTKERGQITVDITPLKASAFAHTVADNNNLPIVIMTNKT